MLENQEKNLNNPKRNFKGIWIPVEIWEHPNLSYFEKMLWAEINSLDGDEGCFASNEYFMKFFNAGESTIRNGIGNLKKMNLVEQIDFNGRCRTLKIKKIAVRPLENQRSDRLNSSTFPKEKESSKEKEYIYNKKEKREAEASLPSQSILKIKRKEEVFTSIEEHKKLEEKLGIEGREICYEILNDWKKDTPKHKWKKDDYRSITRWVIDAYKEKKKKEQNSKTSVEDISQNIDYAKKLEKELDLKHISQYAIYVKSDKIEFIFPEGNGLEVKTNLLHEEFKKLCLPAITRMHLTII